MDGILSKKHFSYDLALSRAPLHGASASDSGFDITLFNPNIIDDAGGHGTGHRVFAHSTSTASGGPGPS